MSSAKRRTKRKIEMMVRMDLQMRSYWRTSHMEKRERLLAATQALGGWLRRKGAKERAWNAIELRRTVTPYPALGIKRSFRVNEQGGGK